MRASTRTLCPDCGHANDATRSTCGLCGVRLEAPEPVAPSDPPARPRRDVPVLSVRTPGRRSSLPDWLVYLGVGAAVAPVFTFTPILRYMGWFLGSLCHETGHCLFAWLAGAWAFPAISLAGHAMAQHGPPSRLLCFVIWALLAYGAYAQRDRRAWLLLLGGAALLYPLYAFTSLKEVFFLLGGHLGELAFAGVFFWRALVGGFSGSNAERAAYAAVGWYLVGSNVWLDWGLMFDVGVQEWYRSSGSFGLTNDFIRLGRHLGIGLEVVAGMMLVVTLAVLPVAWLFARAARSADV